MTFIPGPAAFVNALVLSGKPSHEFIFVGFLPKKPGARQNQLKELAKIKRTLVFYESCHRIQATLEDIQSIFGDKIQYEENPYKAVTDASAFLLITEWNEFRELDLVEVKKLMKKAIIFDGRNIYDPEEIKELGFIYHGIGRS